MAAQVEYRDVPPRIVAKGIAWLILALLLIVAIVLIFTSAIKPRSPLPADAAKERFRSAGPPLLSAPREERVALEAAHRGPDDAAIERAMDAVVRQGWGEDASAPGRADVAMHRAEAGQ
jgi:hypothetical protein